MKAHVVVIFFPKIFPWGGQNYTLEWIKVGNDLMSDTTNEPSNWELVLVMQILYKIIFFSFVKRQAFFLNLQLFQVMSCSQLTSKDKNRFSRLCFIWRNEVNFLPWERMRWLGLQVQSWYDPGFPQWQCTQRQQKLLELRCSPGKEHSSIKTLMLKKPSSFMTELITFTLLSPIEATGA